MMYDQGRKSKPRCILCKMEDERITSLLLFSVSRPGFMDKVPMVDARYRNLSGSKFVLRFTSVFSHSALPRRLL